MRTKEQLRVFTRWMIRRDYHEVLAIEFVSFGPDAWTEDDFLAVLRERNSIGMIAEVGEKVVGFLVYHLESHHIEILNIAVDPEFRGRGVGRERWDIGKTHAYGLIQFSITIENLFALADEVSILNERQVRPLAGLQPEQQRQAWQEAKTESGDRPPTGKQIALAVKRFEEPPPEPKFLLVEELHQIREWMERRKESWPEDRRDDFEDSVRQILDNIAAGEAAWRRAE